MSAELDVVVVGAGIAGLSLAHALRGTGRAVRVFESADHVGGRMATVRHDGYLIDSGAEQIPTHGYEATWRLLAELGIGRPEVPLIGKGIGMWRDGSAHAGVADPRGLLSGAGLSPRARLDLLRFTAYTGVRRRSFDPDRPERTPLGRATVADLARRYHPELGRYLFDPIVSGFFGWHPDRSAAAAFVSLLAAVGTASTWRTYRDGMDTFARGLAQRVDVTTGLAVHEVVSGPDSVRLGTDRGTVTARQVFLCVPAPAARRIHLNPPADETRFLAACTFTPMLKVSCLLDRPLAPPAARELYALLIPEVEDAGLAAVIVDHAKHPGRAPQGRGLLTLISQPRRTRDLLDAPDDEARALIEQAERYVPGIAAATHTSLVHRFRDGLPEVTPAALGERAAFMRRPSRRVDYAGDWVMLRPSSEGAVRSALLAAARFRTRLAWDRTRTVEPDRADLDGVRP